MSSDYQAFVKKKLLSCLKKNILIFCPKNQQSLYLELYKNNQVYFVYQGDLDAYGIRFSFSAWPFKNRIFDVVVLHNEMIYIENLNKTLKEAYAKLSDSGLLVVYEHRDINCIKFKDKNCKNLPRINYCFLNNGFTKKNQEIYFSSGFLVPFILKPFFLFTNNRFLMVYKKNIVPLTPYRLKELQKDIKAAPIYASMNKIELNKRMEK